MKTNLRYVGKQLELSSLLAVIGIIILQLVWSLAMGDWRWKKSMVHSLSGYLVRDHWKANGQISFN